MKLYLDGLNCANCINKIEDDINNNLDIKVKINFANQTMNVKSDKSIEETIKLIQTKINKYESNVVVKNTKEPVELVNATLIKIVIGFILYLIAYFFDITSLFIITYLLIGYNVIILAFKNIYAKQFLDENFLMAIATIAAIIIGEYPEAVAVMLFYQTGEYFQDLAVNRSRKSITSILNLQAEYANVLINNVEEKVDPKTVVINSSIIIKPGEKVPLDCIITNGNSLLDTRSLTGESNFVEVNIGDKIYAGSINQEQILWATTTSDYENSTASKIIELIENATTNKSQTENFITKFAKYYTPTVVILALLIAIIPPIILNEAFYDWIYRSLIFLVISCPCALVISVPLSYFAGIGLASKNGIIIKGSNYLDGVNNVSNIVFDKTGTITTGDFKVTNVFTTSYSKEELLKYVAYCESYSNHPIATAILSEYGLDIDKEIISDYEQLSGYGIKATIDSKQVLIGNKKLLEDNKIIVTNEAIGTTIYVAINQEYAGYINILDDIKSDAYSTIEYLNNQNIYTYMLTGDKSDIANKVATTLKINKVFANLLPHQKVEKLEEILSNDELTMFVGDGVNDAPVTARSDIGISMGLSGSDATIAASDIVIMNDNLSSIKSLFKISKYTRKIVIQNITFALSIKIFVLILGVFGIASMWSAVFADVGVTLIAILNATRILKYKL